MLFITFEVQCNSLDCIVHVRVWCCSDAAAVVAGCGDGSGGGGDGERKEEKK